jgi:hypothetical protein
VPEHELQAIAHVASAREGRAGVIAEVGALKAAPKDLTQREDAGDRIVLKAADEERLDVRTTAALEPAIE